MNEKLLKAMLVITMLASLVAAGMSVVNYGAGVEVQEMGDSHFTSHAIFNYATAPQITVGKGDAEDTAIVYDGNAQDFYIALDDTADDLLIGLGSAVGTTPGLGIDENLAITTYGDLTFGGTTPVLTVGDAGAEDAAIVFDGNAQDFYVALDDTADDLLLGLGSAVGTTGIVYLDENQDVGLGGASAGAKLDVTGNVLIDGAADEVQLTVQGYTTQTSNAFVVEISDGTDLFWVTNDGDVEMNGTTPALTIGDAGTEDASIVFDGNAQDFYVGLDDTADDLVFGKGATLGTTQAFGIDENLVTTWAGGTLLLTEAASAADTITAAECGKTFFMSGNDYTLTLPAVSTVAAGCEFRFICAASPTTSTIVLTGNSTEDVLIGGINELEVDTGDDGPYDASADTLTFIGGTAVVGDFIYMISDGSYFYVSGQANADGGITITDSD